MANCTCRSVRCNVASLPALVMEPELGEPRVLTGGLSCWSIGQIESLCPKLEMLVFTDSEALKQRGI